MALNKLTSKAVKSTGGEKTVAVTSTALKLRSGLKAGVTTYDNFYQGRRSY